MRDLPLYSGGKSGSRQNNFTRAEVGPVKHGKRSETHIIPKNDDWVSHGNCSRKNSTKERTFPPPADGLRVTFFGDPGAIYNHTFRPRQPGLYRGLDQLHDGKNFEGRCENLSHSRTAKGASVRSRCRPLATGEQGQSTTLTFF